MLTCYEAVKKVAREMASNQWHYEMGGGQGSNRSIDPARMLDIIYGCGTDTVEQQLSRMYRQEYKRIDERARRNWK